MLASSHIAGFVPTTNSERARAFYEKLLGLEFVSENQYVATFRSGGSVILLQKMDKFEPVERTILGWEVDDIKTVVSFLVKRGVTFERYAWMEQDEQGIWASPDGKVAWFKDPDGNILSVAQH